MKRSTLILILIALGLGLYVYFVEIKRGKPRDEKADETKPAFTFKREDITAISITRQGQTTTLENRNGNWVITKPINGPADQSTVDTIVSGIVDAREERTINASKQDIKSFGLENPSVVLEVKLRDGKQHKIRLGNKDFSDMNVYAQLNDNQNSVALVSSTLLTNADKPLNELRDRSVLAGASQYDINGLKVDTAGEVMSLAKEDGKWVIKSPVQGAADETAVDGLITEITSAKATDIVSETSDDLKRYGLDNPGLKFTAQLQGGTERTLLVGKKENEKYYARLSDRPQVFTIETTLYDKLNTKVSEYRDKQVVKVNQDEINRVRIQNKNQTLVAEKKDAKWIIKEPADQKEKEAQRPTKPRR
jgi:predicted  nucleic acid-binding Zn-ribbon protein